MEPHPYLTTIALFYVDSIFSQTICQHSKFWKLSLSLLVNLRFTFKNRCFIELIVAIVLKFGNNMLLIQIYFQNVERNT